MLNKYSVLMSVYIGEEAEFTMKAIDSMLQQTIKPSQIVIVEDGPLKAEVYETLKNYEEKLPGLITRVPLERNVGLGLALNEGINACEYELIARMDTDDISYLDRCEKQLKIFQSNPELDIVGAWTNEFHHTLNDTGFARVVPETQEEIVQFSKRRSPFNHATVMYKKNSVLKVGGYRHILRNEDLDLFLRMLQDGAQGYNIQEPLLHVRADDKNLQRRKTWQNTSNYIKAMKYFWDKKYITSLDYFYVIISQIGVFLMPSKLLNWVSNRYLRKNID